MRNAHNSAGTENKFQAWCACVDAPWRRDDVDKSCGRAAQQQDGRRACHRSKRLGSGKRDGRIDDLQVVAGHRSQWLAILREPSFPRDDQHMADGASLMQSPLFLLKAVPFTPSSLAPEVCRPAPNNGNTPQSHTRTYMRYVSTRSSFQSTL